MHLQTHMLWELNDIIHRKAMEECHALWCQSKLEGQDKEIGGGMIFNGCYLDPAKKYEL